MIMGDRRPISWKLAGKSIAGAVFILAELVLTHYLTNVLPILDFVYDPLDPAFNRRADLGSSPEWEMILTLWAIPSVWLIFLHGIIVRWDVRKMFHLMVAWVHTIVMAIFVAAVLRYFIPYPRTFFGFVCRPTRTTPGYVFRDRMCGEAFQRRDVQAFPSGHAMSVVASWAFIVLVAAHGLKIFHKGTRTFWKVHVIVLPSLIVPIYVCGDRLRSGNHTPAQVIWGSIFGLMTAILVFLVMDREALIPTDVSRLI